MNLYDYPELKQDLEDMLKGKELPLSICQFGVIKSEELCNTFLSECSHEFKQETICDLLEDDDVKEYISQQYSTSGGFGNVLEMQLLYKVSEFIDDMLDQVSVSVCREDYYD